MKWNNIFKVPKEGKAVNILYAEDIFFKNENEIISE